MSEYPSNSGNSIEHGDSVVQEPGGAVSSTSLFDGASIVNILGDATFTNIQRDMISTHISTDLTGFTNINQNLKRHVLTQFIVNLPRAELCVYDARFAEAIGNVLLTEIGSAAVTKDPQTQLQVLILDPLQTVLQSRSRPILIVVDALDECDEKDRISVLTGLFQLVQRLPSFKVILTTRPQSYADRFLGGQDNYLFRLQAIEDQIVDHDIRRYITYSLSLEQIQEHYPGLQWCASNEEIDILVRAAGKLFIIASTAVRYILDKSASNPAAQMQKLLRTDLARLSAPLDGLYLETLNSVPDQAFLMTFLGLFVARCSISGGSLSDDDAILMHVSNVELEERLRGMHSILKFKPYIDVHNPSFLEFLQDPSRSGQYYISKSAGTRKYLELMTKLLIGYAAKLIEQPDFHGIDHFAPEFGKLINRNPHAIKLHIEDWEQTLRPLVNELCQLLEPSRIDSLKAGYCPQCQFFQTTYDALAHFNSLWGKEGPDVDRCLKSLEEIRLYGDRGQQEFNMNFGRVVFGTAAIVGFLTAILAHRRRRL